MTDEDAFLNSMLASPGDDITRLVYADWLEERDDPISHRKAHVLRLLASPDFDPTIIAAATHTPEIDWRWLRVVSKAPIMQCVMGKRCPGRWDARAACSSPSERLCNVCGYFVTWQQYFVVGGYISESHRPFAAYPCS